MNSISLKYFIFRHSYCLQVGNFKKDLIIDHEQKVWDSVTELCSQIKHSTLKFMLEEDKFQTKAPSLLFTFEGLKAFLKVFLPGLHR